MSPFGQTYIGDWKVNYTCYEFKPDGWLPGEPLKYATYAIAEPPQADRGAFDWKPVALLRYPQEDFAAVFSNDREGLDKAIAELTKRIENSKTQA